MELPIIYNDHTQTQNLRNKKPSMHNAETGSKFIFDDFSASKFKQPATETLKPNANHNQQCIEA